MGTLFAVILFALFVPSSYAANYHWKIFVPGKGEKSIGEDATEVAAGDWYCFIGAIHSIGPFGGELRTLDCSVGKDGLKAGVTASCEPNKKGGKPTVRSGVMGLEQKSSAPSPLGYTIMLRCS